MDRNIYVSASSLMTDEKVLGTIANNIANVNTVGYKKDIDLISYFSNKMITKINENKNLGYLKNQVGINETKTIFSMGGLEFTGNKLDFAIKGNGFFKVLKDNQYLYTRDGHFMVDREGYLVNNEGAYILNKNNQPIKVSDNVDLTKEIRIVDFNNLDGLRKIGNNYFVNINNEIERDVNIELEQGVLETSNVQLEEEFALLLKVKNKYSFNSKILSVIDQNLEKTIDSIKI